MDKEKKEGQSKKSIRETKQKEHEELRTRRRKDTHKIG
jgi:hypothetical protein